MGTGSQGLESPSADFTGHKQGARSELGQKALGPRPVWKAITGMWRISLLSHSDFLKRNCFFLSSTCALVWQIVVLEG